MNGWLKDAGLSSIAIHTMALSPANDLYDVAGVGILQMPHLLRFIGSL